MDEKKHALTLDEKKIDETRNYLLEEIKHNELISKNHKNTWTTLNYMKDMLIYFLLLPDVFPFLYLLL